MFGNLMRGLVQPAPAACYDLQTGRLGVRNGNGFGTYDPPTEATTGKDAKDAKKGKYKTCSVKEFAISVPAFSIRTPVGEIKAGDLVVIGDKSKTEYYFFVSLKTESDLDNPTIQGINTENGKITNIAVPDQAFLPGFGILTVKNLFSTVGGIESIMPLMMLMKQDASSGSVDGQFGKFLMLSAMSGGNIGSIFGGKGDAASMMPMLMMMGGGFKGGMKDILMLQMLTGAGNGDMSKMLPMIALMGSLDDAGCDVSVVAEQSEWMNQEVQLKDSKSVSQMTNIKPVANKTRTDVIANFRDYNGVVIKDNGASVEVECADEGTFEIVKSAIEINE